MKKILGILGTIGIAVGTGMTVVACSDKTVLPAEKFDIEVDKRELTLLKGEKGTIKILNFDKLHNVKTSQERDLITTIEDDSLVVEAKQILVDTTIILTADNASDLFVDIHVKAKPIIKVWQVNQLKWIGDETILVVSASDGSELKRLRLETSKNIKWSRLEDRKRFKLEVLSAGATWYKVKADNANEYIPDPASWEATEKPIEKTDISNLQGTIKAVTVGYNQTELSYNIYITIIEHTREVDIEEKIDYTIDWNNGEAGKITIKATDDSKFIKGSFTIIVKEKPEYIERAISFFKEIK